MKDTLLIGLFGLGVVIAAYLAGASMFAWISWDIAMYNPEIWNPIARALLGIATAFILWVSLCFAADDLSYKDKYRTAMRKVHSLQEVCALNQSIQEERNSYEGPYRCRYTSVRVW